MEETLLSASRAALCGCLTVDRRLQVKSRRRPTAWLGGAPDEPLRVPFIGGYLATLNNQKAVPTGLRHSRLPPTLIWPVYRGERHRCELEAEHNLLRFVQPPSV